MSDRMAAEIFIGGTIPSQLVAPLCRAITADGVSLDWGDAVFQPATARELLTHRRDHHGVRVLALCDDQARSGCFETLEQFLITEDIAFDRYHEAKYEFDAEWVCYRPGRKPLVLVTDADRRPIVRADVVAKAQRRVAAVLAALEKSNHAQALVVARRLRRILIEALPTVEPLFDFTIKETR